MSSGSTLEGMVSVSTRSVARILFNASAVGFAISEVSIRVRSAASRSGSKVDHGSIVAVLVAMTIGVLAAVWFAARVPAAKISYQGVTLTVGLVAMWLGIALRQWAVWTLGRLFTIVVRVEANQIVVATGPYRWVRHPSYTGLLMTLFGVGVALDNWLSVLALVTVPALGLVIRIRVEERNSWPAWATPTAGTPRSVSA